VIGNRMGGLGVASKRKIHPFRKTAGGVGFVNRNRNR
jgi:hypothetical protein